MGWNHWVACKQSHHWELPRSLSEVGSSETDMVFIPFLLIFLNLGLLPILPGWKPRWERNVPTTTYCSMMLCKQLQLGLDLRTALASRKIIHKLMSQNGQVSTATYSAVLCIRVTLFILSQFVIRLYNELHPINPAQVIHLQPTAILVNLLKVMFTAKNAVT